MSVVINSIVVAVVAVVAAVVLLAVVVPAVVAAAHSAARAAAANVNIAASSTPALLLCLNKFLTCRTGPSPDTASRPPPACHSCHLSPVPAASHAEWTTTRSASSRCSTQTPAGSPPPPSVYERLRDAYPVGQVGHPGEAVLQYEPLIVQVPVAPVQMAVIPCPAMADHAQEVHCYVLLPLRFHASWAVPSSWLSMSRYDTITPTLSHADTG